MANLNYLSERREAQLLKHMFLRSLDDKFLDLDCKGPITRSKSVTKLKTPYYRSTQAQKSVIYRGSVMWNAQNRNLKMVKDKKVFNCIVKKNLKEKLLNYGN